MTKVKRGYIARKCRKKNLAFVSGSRGAHSKLLRTANQRKARALVSAHQDRGKHKRDLCRLWITRINATTHANGVLEILMHIMNPPGYLFRLISMMRSIILFLIF